MSSEVDAVVAGAGGFIGGHLVKSLVEQGLDVRAVDTKPFSEWHQFDPRAANEQRDLSRYDEALGATAGARDVYDLAADMGGMGFIESHKADCMLSVLTGTHLLLASRDQRVERFFFASSACVYAAQHQTSSDVTPLREGDAYPAMPEDGYGWEKLFTERMCGHFLEDYGLQTRIARYHNVYGEHGTWTGGREKAPAAVCRKVAQAVIKGDSHIDIWGDGRQTRSFTYIDDCITGTKLVMNGADPDPVNIGSDELVTVNQLVDLVEQVAGTTLTRRYQLDAPQGVRGRCSDNTEVRARYGWQPDTRLLDGIERTYRWVFDEVTRSLTHQHQKAETHAA